MRLESSNDIGHDCKMPRGTVRQNDKKGTGAAVRQSLQRHLPSLRSRAFSAGKGLFSPTSDRTGSDLTVISKQPTRGFFAPFVFTSVRNESSLIKTRAEGAAAVSSFAIPAARVLNAPQLLHASMVISCVTSASSSSVTFCFFGLTAAALALAAALFFGGICVVQRRSSL
jgi:hypothetical protein